MSHIPLLACFFCRQNPSHRAAIPLPVSLSLRGLLPQGALDLRRAVYIRHFRLSNGAVARTKVYAHRQRRSLLVTQVAVHTGSCQHECGRALPLVDTGAGNQPSSTDIDWHVSRQVVAGTQVYVWQGNTREAEIDGIRRPTVAVVFPVDAVSAAASGRAVITAIRTSLDGLHPVTMAVEDFEAASQLTPADLFAEHERAWTRLWQAGLEVEGRDAVAKTVNSSLYFLLSSLRDDVAQSVSPGGLASNGYNGHTFWDCETWM